MGKLGSAQLNEPILPHVQKSFTSVQSDQTVGEALEALRSQNLAEKIVYFYVLNNEGQLVGILPTRRLLMSAPRERIEALMVTNVVVLPHDATVLDACERFIMYRFLALPVVDDDRKMLGVADINLFTDEVFSMAEQRNAEGVFQLIGMHVSLGRQNSPWASFKDRFPWLLCNIVAGILCALLSGLYTGLLDSVIVLALFIPVVLALSESVSIQSLTLTLRTLRTEKVSFGTLMGALRREGLIAAMIGLAAGLIVALTAGFWKGASDVAVVLGVSISGAVLASSLLGILIPTMVRALRFDPRVAAGPITLACADLLTLTLYFSFGQRMLDQTIA